MVWNTRAERFQPLRGRGSRRQPGILLTQLLAGVLLAGSGMALGAVQDSSGQRTLGAFSDRAMVQRHGIDWTTCRSPDGTREPSAIAADPGRFNPVRIQVRIHQGDEHSVRRRSWSNLKRDAPRELGGGRLLGLSAVPYVVDTEGRAFPLIPQPPEAGGFERYFIACEPEQSVQPYPDLYPSVLVNPDTPETRERLADHLGDPPRSELFAEPQRVSARFVTVNGEVVLRSGEGGDGEPIRHLNPLLRPVLKAENPVAFLQGWTEQAWVSLLGFEPKLPIDRYRPADWPESPQRERPPTRTAAAQPDAPAERAVAAEPDPSGGEPTTRTTQSSPSAAEDTEQAAPRAEDSETPDAGSPSASAGPEAPAAGRPTDPTPPGEAATSDEPAEPTGPTVTAAEAVTLRWPASWDQPVEVSGCAQASSDAGQLRCRRSDPETTIRLDWGPGWATIAVEPDAVARGEALALADRLRPRWPSRSDDPLLACRDSFDECYLPYRLSYCFGSATSTEDCCGRRAYYPEIDPLPSLAELECPTHRGLPQQIRVRLNPVRGTAGSSGQPPSLAWDPNTLPEAPVALEDYRVAPDSR